MRALRVTAAALVLCGFSRISPPARAQGGLVQVTALVTVMAEKGEPVTNLTAADFIVRDDGTQRVVTKADAASQVPLYVTILLDVAKPPMGVIPPIRDMRMSLANFVAAIRAANPGAQISFVEVSGAPLPRVAFDAKEGELDEAIGRVVSGQTSDAAVLEGIAEAARVLKNTPTIRRAIVSIDFSSPESGADRAGRVAVEEVLAANASFWGVTIRDSKATTSRREPGLTAAANTSGGARLTGVSATGLDAMLKKIAHSLSSQYLVTFSRPGGVIREITVETAKGHKAMAGVLLR